MSKRSKRRKRQGETLAEFGERHSVRFTSVRCAMDEKVLDEHLQAIPRGGLLTLPAGMQFRTIDDPPFAVKKGVELRLSEWPDWQSAYATDTARGVAAGIVETGEWSRLAILADAIQDAGCEDAAMLGLLRLAGGLELDMTGWWLMNRLTDGWPEVAYRDEDFTPLLGLV